MGADRRAGGEIRRILVVKLSSFGDIVLATGALEAIKRAHPRADLRVAVEDRWSALLSAHPAVDGLIEAPIEVRLTPRRIARIHAALAAERRRGGDFDLAIDLQGTRRSAAWVYLARARVMAGRGAPRPAWRFALPHDRTRHAVDNHAEVCARLGIDTSGCSPSLAVAAEDDARLEAILAAAGLPARGAIVLNPLSRWPSKSWDPAKAAELAARIAGATGMAVIVTGGPDEAPAAADIVRRAGAGRVSSLAGRLTLGEALALYRRARLVVSCDSGPMHAAAALGTRVVALFGPTLPAHTGPWGPGHALVQARRPRDHHAYRRTDGAAYMADIGVDAVAQAVSGILRTGSPERAEAH